MNVCGNPAPVVDRVTGEIFLLTTWNRGSDTEKIILNGTSADQRRVFVQSSKDNGATWSKPREIPADGKKPHWLSKGRSSIDVRKAIDTLRRDPTKLID